MPGSGGTGTAKAVKQKTGKATTAAKKKVIKRIPKASTATQVARITGKNK